MAGRRILGWLNSGDRGGFSVNTGTSVEHFQYHSVVGLEPIDIEQPWYRRLRGDARFGLDATKGSETLQRNLGANVVYRATKYELDTKWESMITHKESQADSQRINFSSSYERFLCERWYWRFSAGCTTTLSISDSAVDPEWQGEAPDRVMIIGLDERRYRTPFESTFAAELRSRGFDAVTSTAYAPMLEDFEDSARFDAIMQQANADSVMTVKAVGFREPNNTAWSVAYIAAALLAENYQQSRGMRAMVAAGALADNTAAAHYGLEVQFFDVKSDRMIWTAKTKTFDGGNLVIRFADVMIDDLIAKGVITE